MSTPYPHAAIHLKNEALDISVTPQGGAIISGHLKDGRAFLRPTTPAPVFSSLDHACFPMVPLCNRMSNNHFDFEGRPYHAAQNSPVDPLYIHGDGWLSDWHIKRQSSGSACLSFEHIATERAPFTYAAEQDITLEASHLTLRLSVTNKGERAMPFGFGLHPYFPRTADMTLGFASTGHWENNAANLPQIWTPSAGEMDFNKPRGLPDRLIDNCFMDWDGYAQIIWPNQDMALQIKADDIFKTCQIYAPQNQPFFCFEPMSHMADGLSRPDYSGFKILSPGETLSGRVDFHVKDSLTAA